MKRQYRQNGPWSARQPLDCEIRNQWNLPDHEQLPKMSRGTLVGLAGSAEYYDMTKHHSQGRGGHRERKNCVYFALSA